jgi:CubicO group peptidase (beta-lactamase class C family)
MVLDGDVDLEEPVEDMLDFPLPKRNGHSIRVIDLVTHTSGLPKYPCLGSGILGVCNLWAKMTKYTLREAKRDLAEYQLTRDIGDKYLYSNYFALVGHALGRKTGRGWQRLLSDRVIKPLGMTNTSVEPSGRWARGHLAYLLTTTAPSAWPTDSMVAPAGALRSNVRDMLRYLAANLRLGETPLAQAMSYAQETHYRPNGRYAKPKKLVARLLNHTPKEVGLAWWKDPAEVEPSTWIVQHAGATSGFMSSLVLVPKYRVGLILLTNSVNPSFPGIVQKMVKALIQFQGRPMASGGSRCRTRRGLVDTTIASD